MKSKPAGDHFDQMKFELACIKENFEYRRLWDQCGNKLKDSVSKKTESDSSDALLAFVTGLASVGVTNIWIDDQDKFIEDILTLLDPAHDIDEVPADTQRACIGNLFRKEPGIRRIWTHRLPFLEGINTITPQHFSKMQLDDYHRVLLVDLRKSKAQLKAEFEAYLDRVEDYQKSGNKWARPGSYDTWQQDRSRWREESWRHLAVWKQRRKKKTVDQIRAELDLSEDQLIYSYRQAFELTQGRPYNPDEWKQIRDHLHRGDLRKTCADCSEEERTACAEQYLQTKTLMCPDAEMYAQQDEVGQREFLITSPDFEIEAEESYPYI